MPDVMSRWREEQNRRWSQGGGYVAARLWWLFFALSMGVLLTSNLFYAWHNPRLGRERTSNLKQIGIGLSLYMQDHEERLPPMEDVTSLRRALTNYLPESTTRNVWQPPGLNVAYAVNTSLSHRSNAAFPHPDTIVAVWDTRVQGGGHTVLFLDTHVKFVPLTQWERLRLASGIMRDVPAPPLSWWRSRTSEDFRSYAAGFVVLLAVMAALAASWREAQFHARKHGRNFCTDFIVWFLRRFLGYGFCVLLAAFVVSLFLGNLIVLPLTHHRYR